MCLWIGLKRLFLNTWKDFFWTLEKTLFEYLKKKFVTFHYSDHRLYHTSILHRVLRKTIGHISTDGEYILILATSKTLLRILIQNEMWWVNVIKSMVSNFRKIRMIQFFFSLHTQNYNYTWLYMALLLIALIFFHFCSFFPITL